MSKILEATPATTSKMMVPSPITVSMAKSAASAVTSIISSAKRPSPATSNNNRASLLKPSSSSSSNKHKSSSSKMIKTSPESSRSSSRNSSVSPRERPQGSGNSKTGNNRASPPSASKKQPKPKAEKISKPLIPWSQRNLGPPKNSNGWTWVGEGIEQKVYLNVSIKYPFCNFFWQNLVLCQLFVYKLLPVVIVFANRQNRVKKLCAAGAIFHR